MLAVIEHEVDPDLEMAEIHRRVYEAGGPALLFQRVKGSPFAAVSNLYSTTGRVEYIFRHTIERVRRVVELKADPAALLRDPVRYLGAPLTALRALPLRTWYWPRMRETTIGQLPQIRSWPDDGGAFITLPQVLTEAPGERSIMRSNLGMYRIQLSGNDYEPGREVGMHYQIHRGIGVHHTLYQQHDAPFRASIFVGGPPSHALAAIFPLPEGLSELTFAGMLGARRFRYHRRDGYVVSNDADFVITGTIDKYRLKPEGPFGDHLGYYSLKHDFPLLNVDRVYHRPNALWHFTVVGRPPQEDSGFGYLIHHIVGPMLQTEFPGVRSINAVDAAGVHPLLLAIGSERYMPFRQTQPEEILVQANHILGSGQTSLAKYLIIVAGEGHRDLSTHDIRGFFDHVLQRVDWRRDLHFQTCTTIDTLDYSGSGWNTGSKLVIAACGQPIRTLANEWPANLVLPAGFTDVRLVQPGIVALQGPRFESYDSAGRDINTLTEALQQQDIEGFPLIVLVDDAHFTAAQLNNFLWVTFTRSNPSHDVYGVSSFVLHKHWGCSGPLVIDARTKPHHAPGLEVDPDTRARVDRLFARGGPLYGLA